MKISVDELSVEPRTYSFEAEAAWHRARAGNAAGDSFEPVEPLRLDLTAHRMGSDLHLEGSLRGSVEAECSRCLARYRHALRESVRLILEPAGDRVPVEPETAKALARDGMCLGEEFETGWYRGSQLELESFAAEVIELALPMQPLCREACAGLCPVCGADRNGSQCGCSESKPDSPFAALAALRDRRDEGDS